MVLRNVKTSLIMVGAVRLCTITASTSGANVVAVVVVVIVVVVVVVVVV